MKKKDEKDWGDILFVFILFNPLYNFSLNFFQISKG